MYLFHSTDKNWKNSAAWMFAISRKRLLTTAKICDYHFNGDFLCIYNSDKPHDVNQNRNVINEGTTETEVAEDEHDLEDDPRGFLIYQGLNEK